MVFGNPPTSGSNPDPSMQGTGKELGRIPLGDYGYIVISDDGCNDDDVTFQFEDENGVRRHSGIALNRIRRIEGDSGFSGLFDAIKDVLESHDGCVDGSNSATPPLPRYTGGPIICHDCGLTWPGKRNQTPDPNQPDTCPKCHEDDEDL